MLYFLFAKRQSSRTNSNVTEKCVIGMRELCNNMIESSRFTYVQRVFNDEERFTSDCWNGRGQTSVPICRLAVSILFVMAASSTNDIIDLLERLLKILKEENAFNRSDDQPVIRFRHPHYLQVNNSSILWTNRRVKISNILACYYIWFLQIFF